MSCLYYSYRHSRWTRREEADFYKVVSSFGVERNPQTGEFLWNNFRNLARLDKKYDDTLAEYFRAFYHMCMSVCHRFTNENNGAYNFIITFYNYIAL